MYFKEGTALSTPTYTTHRDPRVCGDDALEFEPERWLGDNRFELEKSFLGFRYGPRGCIGRNVSLLVPMSGYCGVVLLLIALRLRSWS